MNKDRRIKTAVLMGGVSSEREVSLHSGKGVAAALLAGGFDVFEAVLNEPTLACIDGVEIDVAFVALHGAFGEDGQVQELLERAGIPYTGSGPGASRDAMDKTVSKRKFVEAGVRTPPFVVLDHLPEEAVLGDICAKLGPTLVVKPSAQGSSIGVSITERDGFAQALGEALKYDGRAVVEPCISGRELTVGIIGREALPVIELRPHRRFFDYVAKYSKGETDYVIEPDLPDGAARDAQGQALSAFECLGCRDLARVDMIMDEEGRIFVFEVNTIPGFTQTSLVPMAAAARGRDFATLCRELVEMALERFSAAKTV